MSMSDMTKRAIDASLAEIGRVVVLEAERDRYRDEVEALLQERNQPIGRHAHIKTSHGRLVARIHEHTPAEDPDPGEDWHDERVWVPADSQKERLIDAQVDQMIEDGRSSGLPGYGRALKERLT